MVYAVAIDDEKKGLEVIENYCGKLSNVHLLKCFTDPAEALEYINAHNAVNTVFLGSKIKDADGVELVKKFRGRIQVVFTAASHDQILNAYDVDAVDYLLKPFSFDRFQRAVFKTLVMRKGIENINGAPKKLAPSHDDVILVKCDHKNVAVRLSELLYIQAAKNYVILYTLKGKIIALNTMKSIEDFLSPYRFIRVHKSFIISFQYTEAFEKNRITIRDMDIPIGESYRESMQDFLSKHSSQI